MKDNHTYIYKIVSTELERERDEKNALNFILFSNNK